METILNEVKKQITSKTGYHYNESVVVESIKEGLIDGDSFSLGGPLVGNVVGTKINFVVNGEVKGSKEVSDLSDLELSSALKCKAINCNSVWVSKNS